MQNYKKYAIPPAQLIIADVPYNVGSNFYGSNPMWYVGGDNKNGESKLAKKAAFNSDFNFNLYEYFHFCSKMLKKEPKKAGKRGRSSDAPCMIVFCSFEQLSTLINAAKKHGFVNYIPLVFVKNYSPQVLKANMRVVGATEYALVLYRDKLPKFRNGAQFDENGKTIRGTGHMVFNWFKWEKDGKDIPKIHPAQKPVWRSSFRHRRIIPAKIIKITPKRTKIVSDKFGEHDKRETFYELDENAAQETILAEAFKTFRDGKYELGELRRDDRIRSISDEDILEASKLMKAIMEIMDKYKE